MGRIANYAASYACEQSGGYALRTTVGTLAKDTCAQLVKMVPSNPAAKTA